VSALWVRALGPLEIIAGGAPVVLGSSQQRIVLECLALRANSVVTTDLLVEAVWANNPPAKPGPQLQVYIANLRRLLEPDRPKGAVSERLFNRLGGYILAVADDELDLLQFRGQVAAGELAVQDGDLSGGADCLRQAVGLFKGQAFPDLADIEMFRPELDKLEEIQLDVHQNLIDVELALGRHGQLVSELQSLVAEHPYREQLRASLILALYRSDRQAEALAACRSARQVFMEELGVDPGVSLQELERSILQHDPRLAAPATDGHRRVRQRLDNLPAELTPLVGRESELVELCSLFEKQGCRMVTITGPGGTGKTRLALAAARRLGARTADGVCWVDLAPLTQIHQVPAALARALGLEGLAGADPLKMVTSFLHTRRLLLVFDNFEHLEAAWSVVVELLTAAQDLQILVTSRRPLGLRSEYEFDLAPLALPPLDPPLPPQTLGEVPAVALFLSRGRAVRPHLNLSESNASVVARICCRLDGLPLAIELAAAQLRRRTENELLDDLEVTLGALPGAFRDLPDRQRTLTATIEWSYRLLDDGERELFDRLGVFAGDPTLAAVNNIRALVAEKEVKTESVLNGLARHSLLHLYKDPSGEDRVSMLQSIREFARDQLASRGHASTVFCLHAKYYLSLAGKVAPQLWTPDQVGAFRLLQADAADLRAALLWASGPTGTADLALQLVGHLWHYWELTADVSEQCDIALELVAGTPDAPVTLKGPALSGTATLCWILGRSVEATDLHHQALEAFRRAGDEQGVAWSIACLALQAVERNDYETAQQLATEALSAPQASTRTQVAALIVLGLSAFYAGDYDRALEVNRQSVTLARPLGDRALLGIVLTNLADSTEMTGDYDAAEQMLHEALTTALELGAKSNMASFLESLASVYVRQHRAEQAIRVLGAVEAYRNDWGLPLNTPERARIESIITEARTATGPVQFGLAWAGGQTLTLTQIVNEALQVEQKTSNQEPVTYNSMAAAFEGSPDNHLTAAPWS
jgi:predicted ATPase/DNA-binding SARP family transcriptional activator